MIGQVGYGLHRLYEKAPDPEFLNDDLYRQGYTQGDKHCSVYVNKSITL
jgi:hypothetical protein